MKVWVVAQAYNAALVFSSECEARKLEDWGDVFEAEIDAAVDVPVLPIWRVSAYSPDYLGHYLSGIGRMPPISYAIFEPAFGGRITSVGAFTAVIESSVSAAHAAALAAQVQERWSLGIAPVVGPIELEGE